MPSIFKTAADINFDGLVAVQQACSGQFTSAAPSDVELVFENGIWKYPILAAAGAVVVPQTVRLTGLTANLGASTAWTLNIAPNAANTSATPYPAVDANDYLEGTYVLASGTGQYLYFEYPSTGLPVVFKGQKIYMTTVAGTNPIMRMVFRPEK